MIAEIPKVKVWALLTAALGIQAPGVEGRPDLRREEDRRSAGQDAEERAHGEQLARLLLPLEPAAVRAGLDLGHQALALGVQVGAVEGALEEPLAGVAAEQDAGGDA